MLSTEYFFSEKTTSMARYQILYWRYIPLGVKATDLNGTLRQYLPPYFQEVFQEVVVQDPDVDTDPYSTSGFRWEDEQEREGTAAEVTAIIKEFIRSWNREESLAAFEKEKPESDPQFVELKNLDQSNVEGSVPFDTVTFGI